MIKNLLGMVFCLLCHVISIAQTSNLQLHISESDIQEPIVGANIYLEKLRISEFSDIRGVSAIKELPFGKYSILISAMGFESIKDTLVVANPKISKNYKMQREEHALKEVLVKSTRSTRSIKRIPTRVEFIGSEELEEKAIMNASNISMVLRESTGIQIQQTSLNSINSSIRIQGLDGRYTQILKDGFPLFGGFSGGLSINQIPPLDLSQFEIIKGSSSTLYGGGAIAGLVNLVSKTPAQEPALSVQLAQTHVGGSTANVFYSQKKKKFGYTLYSSGHFQDVYDPNNDGFSNLPKTFSLSLNPKLFYDLSKHATLWIGLNGTFDQRQGGDVLAIEEGVNATNSYIEENSTQRISSQAIYENKFNDRESLQIKNSFSFFDRKIETPDVQFFGKQWDAFFEANYQLQKQKTDWIFGSNFYSHSFKEQNNPNPRNQDNMTFGAFANNTTDVSDHLILESGFRTDYVPNWGLFPLPRFSLLYNANSHFSSRLGGGLGYKIPDMFTEEAATNNFENILPIDEKNLSPERSYGANIDFNYEGRIYNRLKVSANQLFYLTSIENSLLLNQQSNGDLLLENANGHVVSSGAETNLKFSYQDFRWFLNYALINTTLNYLPGNPQKPLTAKHQAGTVLMYENEQWRIGYETYYTGSQRLSSGETTKDFFTVGLLIQKHFKWGSPYINFENFTDRRQSRFSPEVFPPQNNPTFAEIYAPTDGFVFTAGIIIHPFGKKKHH